MKIYLIGSLKNTNIPIIGASVRSLGFDVYDQWWCPGPEADDHWQAYCRFRGWSYTEALDEWHAKQVFDLDKYHLDTCDAGILVLPAGKSGYCEMGYLIGQNVPVYLLVTEEPERYDIMARFATKVFSSLEQLEDFLLKTHSKNVSVGN